MKRLLLAAAVLSLAAAGCVQMKMDTVIKADGGGSCDVVYSLSPSAAEAMKDLEGLPDAEGQMKMPDLFSGGRADLEKTCAESGVKLRKYETSTVNGRQQVSVGLDFQKPQQMTAALGSGGGGMGLFRTKSGDYWLRSVPGSAIAAETAREMGEDAGEAADSGGKSAPEMPDQEKMAKAMAAMGKLMQAAAELDVVMRITVPGDILKHNATRVEGRTAIWEISMANMQEASGEPEILFSGKGLKIDAPLWQGDDKGE